jgi:hypothetical protein
MESWIPVKLKVRKFVPVEKRNSDGDEYKWEEFEFNLSNMSHWKPYTNEDEQGKPMLYTMLYMKGAPKGMVLELNGESFLRACKEAVKSWYTFTSGIEKEIADKQ